MEDLRITGLTLNNVGVFDHLELSFEKLDLKDKAEIHIFTGENGTGKTTVLEALTYFDVIYGTSSNQENNLWLKMRAGNVSDSKAVVLNFPDFDLRFFYKQSISAENSKLDQYYEHFLHGGYKAAPQREFYCYFAYAGNRQLIDKKIEILKPIDFNPIEEALLFSKTTANTNIFQWIANNKTRAALAYQKGNKPDSEKYAQRIKRIETAIGDIIGRPIEFILDEQSLNIMVKVGDDNIYYNQLAEGYKSIISWLSDLMFRLDYLPEESQERFTLFLDEIDVHLHPAAQRRILPVLQKLFPKAQIFLTTHSPFVIGSVDDAWVYKFKFDEQGRSILARPPIRTEDANSYRQILESVFDIKQQFGDEVEKGLEEFKTLKTNVLRHSRDKNVPVQEKRILEERARKLAQQSTELAAIVGSEMRQLSRLLNTDFTL